MADAGSHGGPLTKRKPSSRRSATRGARKLARPVDFRWQRPASEVLTRVAHLPSRADMDRPQPRGDLAENLLRTNDALWRRARATHCALVDTTWAQLIRACGFPEDTPTENARRSVRRYLELLAEAGLIAWGGAKSERGQWKCLHVELLEPPSLASVTGRSSSAGQATFACEARRRHETPQQTVARRRQPWRRCGGRRDAVARHSLLWSRQVPTPFSETAGTSFRAVVSDERARPRVRDASDAVAASSRAQANGGVEREGSVAAGGAAPAGCSSLPERRRERRERLDLAALPAPVFAADIPGPSAEQLAAWAAELGFDWRQPAGAG